MTGILDRTPARTRGRGGRANVLVALAALVGLLLATYPMVAQWFSAQHQAGSITGYVEEMEHLNSAERESLLAAAHAYNAAMPEILLTDPYTMKEAAEGNGGAWEVYDEQLRTSGTDVMGQISIPAIDTSLPIYHGTDEETLARGVGHLFGSSLPVGGVGTHSVLTAHTAFTEAHLFDDLDQVEEGDAFFITVAGETLAYRVDQIEVVLPTAIESLGVVDGKDYVTLITCTPRAVNTHRLLVRGERIPLPDAALHDQTVIDETDPGFPWWAVLLAGGSIVIAGLAVHAVRPDLAARVLRRRAPATRSAAGE